MSISEELNKIKNAIFGREVRDAIHDGIKKTYDDASQGGNTNMEVSLARGGFQTLNERLTNVDGVLNSVDSQLAQTETELETVKTVKMDKNTTDISVEQINKNKGKLDQTYMTDEFLQQMLGDTPINAVPSDKSVTTEKLADKAVTPEITSFIKIPTNLFNKNTVVMGMDIDTSTGELYERSNIATGRFISVSPGQTFTRANISRFFLYDANKEYVSSNIVSTLTIPQTVYYIRFSTPISNLDNAQVNLGSDLLPYEPYAYEIADSSEQPFIIKPTENSVGNEELKENAVAPENTTFFTSSYNLFNKETVLLNKVFDTNTQEIVDNPDNFVSDFIPVNPSETYTKEKLGRWVLYNSNKEYVGNNVSNTYTMPSVVYYVRVVAFMDNLDIAQVVKGEEILPYESYGDKLDSNYLPQNQQPTEFDWRNEQNYFIEGVTEGIFSGLNLEDKGDNSDDPLRAYKTADFYALYDALLDEYPEYITRTFLGNDASGTLPIYRYDFKPKEVTAHGDFSGRKFPKTILVSGSHPEITGVYCLYETMKQICENWENDELLETLRWNMHYIVVPIWGPWNFDNGTRYNYNNVNLGRSFPYKFEVLPEGDGKYGGTEPLSEPEAQYLYQILMDNQDALFHIDFHNFFSTDDFVWVSTKSLGPANVGASLIRQLSREWKKHHPIIPKDEYVGYITSRGSLEGHNCSFAETLGMRSLTFEVGQATPWEEGNPRFSSMALSLGTEAFINFLMLMLRYTVEEENTIRRIEKLV